MTVYFHAYKAPHAIREWIRARVYYHKNRESTRTVRMLLQKPVLCSHCNWPIPRRTILEAVRAEFRAQHRRYSPKPGTAHVQVVHDGRYGCGQYSFVVVAADQVPVELGDTP